MVVGATTQDSARVVTEVTSSAAVRVAVADNPDLTGPQYFGPVTPDAQNVAAVPITGLDPDTRYWWQVEHGGVLDSTYTPGRIWTDAPLGEPGSFMVACAGDAGQTPDYPGVGAVLASQRMSNHPVFDEIRLRDPRRFVCLGDGHYYDMSSGVWVAGGPTLGNYRRAWSDRLLQPRQHQLYREVSWVDTYDDHDFLGNDLRGADDPTGAANCLQAYRERTPTYPLPHPTVGCFHPWQQSRVLFVMLDGRTQGSANSDPDGPAKTQLGSVQKTWLEQTLVNGRSSGAEYLVLFSGSQWSLTDHDDSWAGFATERAELVEMFGDTGWLRAMSVVYADRHAFGLDTGSHNVDGGFPLMMAAALDAAPSQPASDRFDTGFDIPERGQYGAITVKDWGYGLAVTLAGWRGGSLLRQITSAVTVSEPVMSVSLQRALSGSHTAVFEAVVVEDYQTGGEPGGTTVPILAGDVRLDGTAEVRGTLDLTTAGPFPRGNDLLLAPYGNEVFVRRGIDLGDRVEWVPLGYYRIGAAEQDDVPDGPIHVPGADRMAGIKDADFLAPRQFAAERTIGSVVHELVREVYPNAAIVWDDDTAQQQLGRVLVVEESRYEGLLDVVTSRGKICYFDGAGVLQIRTAPDPSEPVWEVTEGAGGVLVQASRRLTREGVYNGVVAIGEGADTDTPARAVVVDRNPRSATFWGGRFGQIPRFYSSPVITTDAQADAAARSILSRSIGFPYSVDFTAVPHPGLEPHHAVRVRHAAGRDVHVIQAVTIPLTVAAALTATTKEQTLIALGAP